MVNCWWCSNGVMASEKLIGIESSAVSVLKRAVEYDTGSRLTSALVCYQEGIQLLLDVLKGTTDEVKRTHIRNRIKSYMDRAEEIKRLLQKEKDAGTYNEKIQIPSGGRGFGYDTLIGQLLDSAVRSVEVEDPYIMAVHQIQNFVRLCELLISKCKNLDKIHLLTKQDERGSAVEQRKHLEQVAESLKLHQVTLEITYSGTLHDREIRLSTGWVVKIGRGLDYFKPSPTRFSIGMFDLNLRECHETTVNIFHRNYLRTTTGSTE